VLYYRRDLLEKAGVDEKTAFRSHSHLIKTLKKLQASGISTPLVLATKNIAPPGLHSLASWVWGAGGDFVSADGNSTLLNQPEMRTGLCNFLELSRFLSPQARGLVAAQSEALFWRGEAAISLSFQPPIMAVLKGLADPKVITNLGVTSVPGVTFIGGSNLVIWRHTPLAHETLAMDLVRFLTGQQAQINYNTKIGFFPTRPDVMQNPPFSTDPFHQVLMKGLNSGRSFPTITQWAIVEDRLLHVLGQLWEDVLSQPDREVDAIIADRLDQLARRLDMMLRPA
jgi:multiple sugar transport system substrate-binding protein